MNNIFPLTVWFTTKLAKFAISHIIVCRILFVHPEINTELNRTLYIYLPPLYNTDLGIKGLEWPIRGYYRGLTGWEMLEVFVIDRK